MFRPTAAFAAILFAISTLGGARAQGSADSHYSNNAVSFILTRRPDAAQLPAFIELLNKARSEGRVRVIVGLNFGMRFPHQISPSEAIRQSVSLRALQDAVLRRTLGTLTHPSIKRFAYIPFVAFVANASTLERLLADPGVNSIQEDYAQPANLGKSTAVIEAPALWSLGNRGSGQVIAILDTGVDKTHPMFADGKIVSEACYSTNDGTNVVSLCPGQARVSKAPGSGIDCPNSVAGCGHGTHVASIAAGSSTAEMCAGPCLGVANQAKIISIQVFSQVNVEKECKKMGSTPCAKSYKSNQLEAIERVYFLSRKFKIAAVNLSLGGGIISSPCGVSTVEDSLTFAFRMLRAANIAPIVASGNGDNGVGSDHGISEPACSPEAIAVGSTTKSDSVSAFSHQSPLVKLMAPGESIVAAIPNSAACPTGEMTGYCPDSGTSMAAPHVAGAFALLRNEKPTATVEEILAALGCTGKPVVRRGQSSFLKRPRIDLERAREYLLQPPAAIRFWPFNSANDGADWTPLFGTWEITGGRYALNTQQLPLTATSFIGSFVENCNEAALITATMKRAGGNHYSGIFVNAVIDDVYKRVSGYFFAYNKKSASIFRVTDLEIPGPCYPGYSPSCAQIQVLCSRGVKPNLEQDNTLEVATGGGFLSFWLNERRVCTVRDATYSAGPIILGSVFPKKPIGQSFSVDQITVEPLQGASAAWNRHRVLAEQTFDHE